jgi:hypothetical protein
MRRDFGQVLRAIKAHALLHQETRQRSGSGAILADIDHDYAVVRELLGDIVSESSEQAIELKIRQTIEAVKVTDRRRDNLPEHHRDNLDYHCAATVTEAPLLQSAKRRISGEYCR